MSIPITNPHYQEGSTQRSEDVDTAKYGQVDKEGMKPFTEIALYDRQDSATPETGQSQSRPLALTT
jgi:hypothetical protein